MSQKFFRVSLYNVRNMYCSFCEHDAHNAEYSKENLNTIVTYPG